MFLYFYSTHGNPFENSVSVLNYIRIEGGLHKERGRRGGGQDRIKIEFVSLYKTFKPCGRIQILQDFILNSNRERKREEAGEKGRRRERE